MSLSAPAQAVRGSRTNSLDHLDFQERRQLIASSLSLTDFLHVGAKEVAAVAVAAKKQNGSAVRTNSLGSGARTPPAERTKSKFSAFGRLFKPWKWKRKKKSEKFEEASRKLERKISVRANRDELVQKGILLPESPVTPVPEANPEGYPFIFWNKPSPWGNSSIRLISPLYSRVLDKNGCFSTSFKMYTNSKSGLVGMRVYQKPDYIALEDLIAYNDEAKKDYILFEVWGDWGPYWYDKESTLKHFESNFQIILEGIFGEEPMYIAISYVSIMQRSDCTGNTAHPIPRPTTSTTISTTTTILTTTTERPLRKNGNKTTDGWEGSPSIFTVEDSPPASPISNLLPTTTRPTTKQPTTIQTLQEENGFDSRNTQMIILLAILGIVLLIFVCVLLAVVLARRRGTYKLNDIRATIVGASSFIDHEKKPSDARYSTKNGGGVVIDCNESKQ